MYEYMQMINNANNVLACKKQIGYGDSSDPICFLLPYSVYSGKHGIAVSLTRGDLFYYV